MKRVPVHMDLKITYCLLMMGCFQIVGRETTSHITQSLLYMAVEENKPQEVMKLLKAQVKPEIAYRRIEGPNGAFGEEKKSPLFKAIELTNPQIALALLIAGHDVNEGHYEHNMSVCGEGYCYTDETTTPLELAEKMQNTELIAMLKKYGGMRGKIVFKEYGTPDEVHQK